MYVHVAHTHTHKHECTHARTFACASISTMQPLCVVSCITNSITYHCACMLLLLLLLLQLTSATSSLASALVDGGACVCCRRRCSHCSFCSISSSSITSVLCFYAHCPKPSVCVCVCEPTNGIIYHLSHFCVCCFALSVRRWLRRPASSTQPLLLLLLLHLFDALICQQHCASEQARRQTLKQTRK